MAQFFFKYGAMNSGKSLEIIKVAHNYEEQNKPVEIFTSALDNRTSVGTVASRTGYQRQAIPITDDMDLFETIKAMGRRYCILIDEAQFLKKAQILQLARVVDELNIPVMAFGLKNDFTNDLFEGSKYLLLYADKIEEIKTICWFCDKKASMNLRMVNGEPVYEGEQIQIGGNESYLPVCRKCYHQPKRIED
ncbi:thymidine kinase [Tuanshanicoccus lijuaniae]|uniref:thymidine kinase n=2 Tax=Aerococcaceae bacterium zg-1292 TaxID=2774330 RepID=UPI0019376842|nr:thymidine kinase [Aerococcaceae bacterium zg-BR9]MBF6978079.1 thymidine kinase [Aerococcaceae bacterium zg-BR22]MBS4456104.1 thymidine kinase [Aerococcaceae bacterium zg-A91]MBS4457856.1 thymidine kinase [Aerococcaceae bacterium zg-BR33]QQA37627.1 thymidine kinase [Aerococcaceae bacterium zg-1292]